MEVSYVFMVVSGKNIEVLSLLQRISQLVVLFNVQNLLSVLEYHEVVSLNSLNSVHSTGAIMVLWKVTLYISIRRNFYRRR
jgi:hypothetical protein